MKRLLSAWASLWTTALLALVYFAALGPACALARAFGWDPLGLDGPGDESYWRACDRSEPGCTERTF